MVKDEEFMPRNMRDAIEHIDERLDEWLAGGNRPFPETWVIIWPGDEGSWAPLDGLRTFSTRGHWKSLSWEAAAESSQCPGPLYG